MCTHITINLLNILIKQNFCVFALSQPIQLFDGSRTTARVAKLRKPLPVLVALIETVLRGLASRISVILRSRPRSYFDPAAYTTHWVSVPRFPEHVQFSERTDRVTITSSLAIFS